MVSRFLIDSTAANRLLQKMLQKAGYHTGMIGKWHLTSDPTGFDYWNILPGQGKYHDPDFIEMGTRKTIHRYATDVITDLSIAFLKDRPKDSAVLSDVPS